jgi:dynein regulatory complex protein 1
LAFLLIYITQKVPRQLYDVLALIRQEASFLTKSGIKPDSVADMDAAVLHSLGVESEDDAAKLVEYFVDETAGNGLITSSRVMDALTAFLKEREETKEKRAGEEEEAEGEGKRNGKRSVAEKDKEKEKEKEKEKGSGMGEEAVKEYWERMAGVVTDQTVSVWERLEAEMVKYNQSLKTRVGLLEGNEALVNQNDELKKLLNQYLSAKINEELIVPPVTLVPQQRRPPASQGGSSRASSRQ